MASLESLETKIVRTLNADWFGDQREQMLHYWIHLYDEKGQWTPSLEHVPSVLVKWLSLMKHQEIPMDQLVMWQEEMKQMTHELCVYAKKDPFVREGLEKMLTSMVWNSWGGVHS